MHFWAAAGHIDGVTRFDAETLLVDLLGLSQGLTQRCRPVLLAAAGENQFEMIRLVKTRFEKLSHKFVINLVLVIAVLWFRLISGLNLLDQAQFVPNDSGKTQIVRGQQMKDAIAHFG